MNPALLVRVARVTGDRFTRPVARTAVKVKKQSPHIFFAAGIGGTVVSTVLACRATLKLSDTLDEIQKDVQKTKDRAVSPRHMATDPSKELARVYVHSGVKLARLYAPAIGVGALSITALTGAHVQMSRRNTALMAAYMAVQEAYDNYRERVREEWGAEKELDIYHAATTLETDGDDEVKVADPDKWSPYARFFDETSTSFEKNPELNRLFVSCQQNYANEKLRAQGHLFLNEVYDMLGFDHTSAGAVVGWIHGPGGVDGYVDFGMYDATNAQFLNAFEPRFVLDFNVDGIIYDKI